MGSKHPCIAWVPILWGKCRRRRRHGLKKINNTENRAPPPPVELPEIDECLQEQEGHIPDLPSDNRLPDVPCDIIANILNRLAANSIFQLWQTNSNDVLYGLTTDSYFRRAHLERTRRGAATSTIVVQSHMQSIDNHIRLFFYNGKSEFLEASTSLDLSSFDAHTEGKRIKLWGSYDGLLLLENKSGPAHFFIWNPITKEQVIVTSRISTFYVCGFYFHPRKREYEVVSARYHNDGVAFQILNLRNNHRRSVGRCRRHPPSRERSPVFIDGTLYWLVDGLLYGFFNRVYPRLSELIFSFNVESEEFCTVAMPSEVCPMREGFRYDQFQLFELEGDLSLLDPSSKTSVDIWVLDHNTKCWVKKHEIPSPANHRLRWDFFTYFDTIEYNAMEGEFIAYYSWIGNNQPQIYSLRRGSWRVFETEGCSKADKFRPVIHTHSLVSLDAADSVIPLEM